MRLRSGLVVDPLRSALATREELLELLVAYCQLLASAYELKRRGMAAIEAPVWYRHLRANGVGVGAVLWALYQGHVDHLEGPGWQVHHSAVVCERSAFALTSAGEAFAELMVGHLLLSGGDEDLDWMRGLLRVGELAPCYDRQERALFWGRHALKCYRQPSGNQEMILLAAEEMGWAQWFDDPLPRQRVGNPKVRLHDAIKCLNRHQAPHLVHFRGDGSGTRVGWQLR